MESAENNPFAYSIWNQEICPLFDDCIMIATNIGDDQRKRNEYETLIWVAFVNTFGFINSCDKQLCFIVKETRRSVNNECACFFVVCD